METRSFRVGSSSVWRNGSIEEFSRSSKEEDDEEALQWAALEKLPTYNRLRRVIFTTSRGEATEIDINDIGFLERKNLMERLMMKGGEDNGDFLLKLKNRIDRVGVELPMIEVRFEHVNVEAQAYVGSRALPTYLNFFTNLVEDVLNNIHVLPSRKIPFTILKDISGILKPSRMTLLLGPPSSGKTTLLMALAGKLNRDVEFSGRVTYNGHGMNEFIPQRTAAYVSQHDLHIGEMTVRETLEFSARCQGVGTRYDMLAELSRREKASNIKPDPDIDTYMKVASTEGKNASVVTDYILKVLGLENCEDTIIGDDMHRGISGGQRKRVTIGEMLVGPAKALFMDEISTGLDSSTTFQIVKSLKQYVHILKGTALISLLQPAPETYDLFDDIILLSDGLIVYQGPREHVLDFFKSMGFLCPERKGVADFLQEVTSRKDQEQYWSRDNDPYQFVTTNEFSEAFQLFYVGQTLKNQFALPFDRRKSHPAALTCRKYGVSEMELLKTCASREYLLMKRNLFVYVFKGFQVAFLGLVTATVFVRTMMHRHSVTDGNVYVGSLFTALMSITFNGISEVPMTIAKLPVFFKQRDLLYYPSWAYSLPICILKISVTFLEVIAWIVMTYYITGYDPNVGRFFRQFLVLLLIHQTSFGIYRLVAAIARNMTVANTLTSFAMVMLVGFGGVVLSREDIKKWWKWGYWTSPLMYGQNAISINEFLGKSWRHVLPNATESLGVMVMKSRGFFPHAYFYWIAVGALLGFILILNLCFTLALTYLNPLKKNQAFMPVEPEKKEGGIATSENKRGGIVFPFQQHSITFDDITYSVDMPQEMKNQGVVEERLILLKGLSGSFRPGVLTALMGVSGAGKTTLMDVLAGRKTYGYIGGTITVSGYPKKQDSFARVSGYCEQNDIHSPHVTVYEALVYSAWLRLPSQVSEETRKMFIEEVMEVVELNPLRQALVGIPGVDGLSTEQRKRLTIAVELVANPSIIFMDEPTSGLDARAAAIVMRTVRNTVDSGRTVVCTIHQPSIDIFEAFDELLLLKHGGQDIYVGPLGHHCCHLIDYFEGIKGVPKIKEGYNPATWMLEVSSLSQELELGVDFADIYRNSELYRRNKEVIQELSIPPPGSKDLHFPSQYSRSFFTQFMACLWKQRCSYWRNTRYTAVRLLYTVSLALVVGSLFWKDGSKKTRQQDLFNATGSMFSATLYLGFQSRTSVQPVVAVERAVFYRERAAGMYAAMAYGIAQVVIELPYVFGQAVSYCVLVYTMVGYEWSVAKFLWNVFFVYFTLLYLTFYGMISVALTPNPHIAAVVSTTFYALWILFAGFLIPRTRIPVWWRWYYWGSPMAWTLYGLTASQFGDADDKLETGQTVKEFLSDYYGFRHDFLGVVAAGIVGFALLFALVFAISIKQLNFQRR